MATRMATKTMAKPAAAQRKTPTVTKPVQATKPTKTVGIAPPNAKTTTEHQPKPVGAKRTAEAPHKVTEHTNTSDDAKRREVAQKLAKEAVKTLEQDIADKTYRQLLNMELDPSQVNKEHLAILTAAKLVEIAKAFDLRGYSGLKKAELVEFLHNGGHKPKAQADSTRDLKERLSAAKKAGTVVGPISTVKVADLKKLVVAAESGQKVTVTKPAPKAPNKGTMDYNKNLIRAASGKGYTEAATAACKKMFGVKSSVSTLKSEQLAQLVKALGLS